jgi:hypothetical protein
MEGQTMKTEQLPTTTPWGEVQTSAEVADGIFLISTAGHGGYYLAPHRNSELSNTMKSATFNQQGFQGFYEEDEDAQIIKGWFNL